VRSIQSYRTAVPSPELPSNAPDSFFVCDHQFSVKARAGLIGSVNSAATKAEQIVKGVRGVKSVDVQVVLMG